jgi:hypothetical protein
MMSFKTFMKNHRKAIVTYVICIIIIITMVLLYVYNNSSSPAPAPAPAPAPPSRPTPVQTQILASRNVSSETHSEQEHLMPGNDSELPNYSLLPPIAETDQLPSLDEMIKGIKKMNDELTEFNKNLDVPGTLNVVNDFIGKGLDELMNNPAFQYLMADQNFAEIFSLLIKTANRLDNNNRHKLKTLLDQLFRVMIKINNGIGYN